MRQSRARFLAAFVFTACLLPIHYAVASKPVCQQFEVGSDKWQKCVEDVANGKGQGAGGGTKEDTKNDTNDTGTDDTTQNNNAPNVACSEFTVGSAKWEDCIKGAATGGGLMPWIIVVPLGVMMIGMAFMFARQAARSRRMDSFSSAQIGSTAGSWLIFMGFVEGAMGVGAAVAESRADGSFGGYGIAAAVLLGVGVLMLIAGIIVTLKSRRKRKVEQRGVPGEARVMRLSQTGTYINENPVFMLELQVNALGVPPFQTQQKFTVPMYLVQRIGPGATLPVKVDPADTSEVVVDWGQMSLQQWTDPTGAGTPPGQPGWPPTQQPGQSAQPGSFTNQT